MRSTRRTIAATFAGVAIGASLAVGIGGWPGSGTTLLIGYPDCEAFGRGLLIQPTNALTSLAFVALGVWIAGDVRSRPSPVTGLLAATIVGVGIGSFVGHAAATDWARTLDSVAIKVMVITFGLYALSHRHEWVQSRLGAVWVAPMGAIIVVEAGWPESSTSVLALLTVLAIGATFSTARAGGPTTRRWMVAAAATLGAATAAWWLGRPNSDFCAPHAVFQLHGLWHILAATGIAFVYQAHRSEVS